MKFTKITNENVQLIAFRVRQFLQRHDAIEFYTDWGWYPKYLNRMGVKPKVGTKHVERTITGYMLKSNTAVRVEPTYGIILNIGSASAVVFYVGDKIKIAPTQITTKGINQFQKNTFTSYFAPSVNIKEAEEQIAYEERMDAMYWEDYERELTMKEEEI